MIETVRKKAGVVFRRKWFSRKWKVQDAFGFTSLRQYLGKTAPSAIFFSCATRFTLLIDLQQNTDDILGAMHKNMRYQIRRAEKDGFVWRKVDDLKSFQSFYNAFASEKGLPRYRDNALASERDFLEVFEIILNETIVVTHAYLVDPEEKRARFIYGASVRLNEEFDRNLIGRANRMGHWNEIQYFKESGLETFDFGGFAKDTEDPEKQGINNFKSAFGGTIVQENTYNSRLYELFRMFVK